MTLFIETRFETKISQGFGNSGTLVIEPWDEKYFSSSHNAQKIASEFWTSQSVSREKPDILTKVGSFKQIQNKPQRKPIDIPQFTTNKKTYPQITSTVRRLLNIFGAVVMSKALQSFFPIDKAVIAVTHDPSEDRNQVVLQLFTQANASQSIAFWDSLENDIQSWNLTLNEREKLIFIRDISLRIHWK
jgi:hypothetical protein